MEAGARRLRDRDERFGAEFPGAPSKGGEAGPALILSVVLLSLREFMGMPSRRSGDMEKAKLAAGCDSAPELGVSRSSSPLAMGVSDVALRWPRMGRAAERGVSV